MTAITTCLHNEPQYVRLVEEVARGRRSLYLHGMVKESTGLFLLSLSENLNRPVFVVSENMKRSMELADEMRSVAEGRAVVFPEEKSRFFSVDSVDSNARIQRLSVMSRLFQKEKLIVCTTISALRKPIMPPRKFADRLLSIHVGDEMEPDQMIEKLLYMGYERVATVEHRGEFAVRGAIVDSFSPSEDRPTRIEFFDVEIDSIRQFDVETQRSSDSMQHIVFAPARPLIIEEDDQRLAYKGIAHDLDYARKHPTYGRDDTRAQEKFQEVLDRIERNAFPPDSDLLNAYLPDDARSSLEDYLPDSGIVVLEDAVRIMDAERTRNQQLAEEYTSLLERGELLRTHMHFRTSEDVLSGLRAYALINLTQILKASRFLEPEVLLSIRSFEVDRFRNRWEDLIHSLHMRLQQNYRILIFASGGAMPLFQRLIESEIPATLIDKEMMRSEEISWDPGKVYITDYYLPRGMRFPDSGLLILTNEEIFGTGHKKPKRYAPRKKQDLLNYQDLETGDYVVHEIYGIGTYVGTETMEYDGIVKDYIKISYKGTDVVYVPTDEMHFVTKYIGNGGAKPRISALGGMDWKKSKARAKKAVDAIAEDLLELYAKRSKEKGFMFSTDSPWQKEFEDQFPYDDTPSQIRATQEIKQDMESDRPMDRLLCGDVGYGKTEVALRAAFKAIMDGKQVAFLAPTTFLTQQHYATMARRFQNFPMKIDFLSRFKTREQQKEVVKGLASGSIDMVVGTHRLLSKDVRYKDLGLLIVDEEQRFGVKDKDKIKSMKSDVDVLTLSATPIPRTLQLSLTGIRDMSLLEEPPEERYPATTYVMEWDPGVVREAIQQELDRGGQVYFVHNRVYDLDSVYSMLHALVPEAAIDVAHGQMSTRELENVMEHFVSGEGDILLSTTIIETGMDIPNANTLIVSNADHMGLAQLYQLKGRIGRSDRQSYAYFTYEKSKIISEQSEKRLKAIRDFTEFGSGYKIAMRDLELRGAGNLLGESQSGHIESIGYELYVKMLEDAVAKAKGILNQESIEEINVDIRVNAFIPNTYIQQSSDKIMMYRQIASIKNEEEYDALVEELIDRYGDIPDSVQNLMEIVLIKREAARIGFSQIKEADGYVELRYEQFELFSVELLKRIAEQYQGSLSFDFQNQPKMKIRSSPSKLQDVKRLIQFIRKLQGTTMEEKHVQ